MKTIFTTAILLFAMCLLPAEAKYRTVTLHVYETTDVHGCFFPHDYINRCDKQGTLARVSTLMKQVRKQHGNNVILLENGDILQGQPTCYYYNYIDTNSENVAASVVNYMQYDAQTLGNHDVETGHAVYDKWIKELKCPVIGANIIGANGKPYVHPYTIKEIDGVKVAILGMITPAIPNWLPENLWKGLRFDDMLESTRYWIDVLKKNEKPDIIIALCHSGREGGIVTEQYEEDASERIAREVEGLDIVFYGHDHIRHCSQIDAHNGNKVWIIDPSNNALAVGHAEITLTIDRKNRIIAKDIKGSIDDVTEYPVDEEFMQTFQQQTDNVEKFVDRTIGSITQTITTQDSFFGSSAFCDLIHNMQLRITGADISFNAPLAFNAKIEKGEIRVSDMFNLYKYENMLMVIRMKGSEIKRHLEMSYDLWVNTMTSPDDHIMLLNDEARDDQQRLGFKNLTFNFDSAAGIDYTVDVTKPNGKKVSILQMSNGKAFDEDAWYTVAMNSYRGNGGGELLTKGAGIPRDELKQRIIWSSERDLRYYLMNEIKQQGVISPVTNGNWRFLPEQWTTKAIERDRNIIFGTR